MGIKISFIGTHGTGKSTLLNKVIEEYPRFQGQIDNYSDAGNLFTEKLLDVFNKDALQLFFYARHLYRVRVNKYLASDRSVLDALCYAKWEYEHGNMKKEMFDFLEEESLRLLNEYDMVFWLRPEFELVGEDKRPEDKQYQLDIDKNFEHYLSSDRVYVPVVRLTGSVENRMIVVRNSIKLLSSAYDLL